ncbi:hypothetical protein [Paenibacillus peoriae]|nr:hypothetical protein [Paenibacillus peoriae]
MNLHKRPLEIPANLIYNAVAYIDIQGIDQRHDFLEGPFREKRRG